MTNRDFPKSTPIWRKHGRRGLQNRPLTVSEMDVRPAASLAQRLTVLVSRNGAQGYLWSTDRGRSRLIKH